MKITKQEFKDAIKRSSYAKMTNNVNSWCFKDYRGFTRYGLTKAECVARARLKALQFIGAPEVVCTNFACLNDGKASFDEAYKVLASIIWAHNVKESELVTSDDRLLYKLLS